MKRSILACSGLFAALATSLPSAQAPKTHRLEATPATVAYGYYWSEAKPALRIASGDIIDVDTLLTNTPTASRAQACPTKDPGVAQAITAAYRPATVAVRAGTS